ncbi:chaperonin GroL [Candidatus Kaiserbacteria bacterium RIFCSPHIGHO2_02_FULL_49_34]|uniref:Chaperonin GroEL n=1 Tax=Candidatus Kaiserbacteria bacterium RIFCSPHIGHO2_02_FULL_49_34 TaxID=1798491 RepID=A0A1F6DI87_9BACT|nr:MAG: chaperonin GroL [Candidatus Kaiserbacteria bacterium RIFCSPHIGHO2_02_FULL_49_34]
MSKQILYGAEAKRKLQAGVDAVANAVKVTIGPRGRNVMLDKGYGGPTITNDGVSIAKDITLRDKFENMGAEMIKEVANKVNDLAGDGTTTATILTQALIAEGLKETSFGRSPLVIRRGMEIARDDVIAALKKAAKPIRNSEEIVQVATISAENAALGAKIAETIEKVGKDGVVTVQESQSFDIETEITEGMQFDKGYVSPYMVTNPERMESEYKDTPILITSEKISSLKDILPLLEKIAQTGRKELIIIAEDIEGEALTTFVLNKLRGGFSVLGIKAPGFGDRKKEVLHDIAVVTGATVVSPEVGLSLENVDLAHLGQAARVVSTKDTTTIVDGKGSKAAIKERVAAIRSHLAQATAKYDKEKLAERLAKLTGGVAVIRVGAATETEMKYLKLKVEDAVAATKAAIDEGIVSGGGTSLAKAASVARKGLTKRDDITDEELVGYHIVLRALEAPLRQIAENAGMMDGAVVLSEVQKLGGNAGYDAQKGIIVADMIAAGIIDPVKVERAGVEYAVSAAGIFLTTECVIADEPEEKAEASSAGMQGMY